MASPTRSLRIGALAAGAAVVGIAAVIAMRAPAEGNTETFDGTPSAPLAFESTDWDVQVHSRDKWSWEELPEINAQHGANCSGPPDSHPNSTYEGSVYICNNHLMTAIWGDAGYALVSLTPNRLVDFSDEAVIEFELSTEKMSTRDWWDITVSPFMDAQPLPLRSALSQGVDLQEPNRNSIVVTTDNGQGAPHLQVIENGVAVDGTNPGAAANYGVTASNQAATRQPFRLSISPTNVKFERLASATGSAVVFFDEPVDLGWTQGVVQFGHHSYKPDKDGAGVPATWHWDTVSISPATPFSIQKATSDRILISNTTVPAGSVTFPAAPANAYLRFSALCKPVINGTARTKMTDSGHPEHTSSYMIPIAEGATSVSVEFDADGWYNGQQGCHAKDFYVWSLSSGAATSTSTATPTATATPAPPTNTPTNTPVPTATPTSTATPVPPTSTPTNTPTLTPTPTSMPVSNKCRVSDRNDQDSQWSEKEGTWFEQAPGLWACLVPRAGRVP